MVITGPTRSVIVDRVSGASTAWFPLDIENRTKRGVRTAAVTAVFLEAGRPLGRLEIGADRKDPRYRSYPRRVEAGSRATWRGVCLDHVPAGADAVRIELAFEGRGAPPPASVEVALADPAQDLVLDLPFEGHWRVTQANGCGSRHRAGGRGGEFAWDFAPIETRDISRYGSSAGLGTPILAPVDGRVVRVVDDVADNEMLKEYPSRGVLEDLGRPDWVFGNHIVIEAGSGAYVLLAHLARGSVLVARGDEVHAGTAIARLGNSGASMRPHLHVQAMDLPDPGEFRVRGLPVAFGPHVAIEAVEAGDASEIVVRRVGRGTPREGSVVAPGR